MTDELHMQRTPTPWLYVGGAGPERHDAAHLLHAHLSMTPQLLLDAVAAALATAALEPLSDPASHEVQQQQQQQQARLNVSRPPSQYAQLLLGLDAVAAMSIDAGLDTLPALSEMDVARTLARDLPAGQGLFLGNSMPIRDMDMYAGPRSHPGRRGRSISLGSSSSSSSSDDQQGAQQPSAAVLVVPGSGPPPADSSSSSGGGMDDEDADEDIAAGGAESLGSLPPGGLLASWRTPSANSVTGSTPATVPAPLPSPLGAPVSANRGASGIDGVLSTAAGFAAGLARPATLLLGDLSFLHDVNGLALLRSSEMAPPLVVVLINNRGGGIFSFLPVAGAVGHEAFERLWGTPQNIDLEGVQL